MRGDGDPVYWVSIGQQCLVLGGTESLWGGNCCYWVSRGYWCLYKLKKMKIWSGVTDVWQLTDFERCRSGALVTQIVKQYCSCWDLQLTLPTITRFHSILSSLVISAWLWLCQSGRRLTQKCCERKFFEVNFERKVNSISDQIFLTRVEQCIFVWLLF